MKGEQLWWELHGTPTQPIQTQRPPHKCISRGGSLGEATADPDRLIAWAVRNVERLIEELDYYRVFTSQLTLIVETKDGHGWSGHTSLPSATASFSVISSAIKTLLADACRLQQRVTGMHLLAEKLCFRSEVQGSLFDPPEPRATRLAQLKAQINTKVGRFAVRSGETLPIREIYADETNNYDICDVHGKICF